MIKFTSWEGPPGYPVMSRLGKVSNQEGGCRGPQERRWLLEVVVVKVYKCCNREYFGGGADRTWWQTGCGRRGMSVNGLPILTLSTIIKANVYWVPGIAVQQTGTFSCGGKRGCSPNHTLFCTFQAMSLARAVSTQRRGAFFYWLLTKRCNLLTKLCVWWPWPEHLLSESHQGPQ